MHPSPDAVLARIVPPKADITMLKLSNRHTAYAVGGVPVLFELDRSPALLPTVHGLWAAGPAARLLPAVHTHSEVSPKVLGGADLFLQGFIVPEGGLPPLAAGDVAVLSLDPAAANGGSGGPAHAFAIGVMECSADEAVAGGMKGKGLRLLHHYPDGLWALGEGAGRVPGPEFTPTRIFHHADGGGGGGGGGGDDKADKADKPAKAPKKDKEKDKDKEKGVAGVSPSDGAAADAATAAVAGLDLNGGAAAEPATSTLPTTPAVPGAALPPGLDYDSQAGQDALALHCLLRALIATPEASLPCLTSDLQARMTGAAPPGVRLDLKKSSFKQLAKLLKKYEKEKLLTVKLVRKQDALAGVDRAHPLYVAAVAAGAGVESGPASPGGGGGPPSSSAAGPSTSAAPPSSSAATSAPIKMAAAYRVASMLRPIFEAGAGPGGLIDKDRLYSAAECEAALRAYADAHGLTSFAGGSSADAADAITLDALLATGLFNKREAAVGDAHPAGDLVERLIARLAEHTVVTRRLPGGGTATAVRRGGPPKLVVSVEDRAGGRKHLTRLAGAEGFALQAADLATALQKRFQTSASLTKLPGSAKAGTEPASEIALQGDLATELAAFLKAEYGLGAAHVEVKGR
jgi:translation initiation factor 2D